MSYNEEPTWTSSAIFPESQQMTCPTCGVVGGNVEQCMQILFDGDYYEPRHIPPVLIFTCDNQECPDVDKDYEFELSIAVTATRREAAANPA